MHRKGKKKKVKLNTSYYTKRVDRCGREDEAGDFQVNRGDPRTSAWTEILTFIRQESFTMNPFLGSLIVASSMNVSHPQFQFAPLAGNQLLETARQINSTVMLPNFHIKIYVDVTLLAQNCYHIIVITNNKNKQSQCKLIRNSWK